MHVLRSAQRGSHWIRLSLFLALLVGASLWWTVREVSADFRERSLSMGRQLDKLAQIARGSTTIELNGAPMMLTSVTRHESVHALLERFAVLCARDSGGVSEQLDELARGGAHIPEPVGKAAFGVYRAESADEREGTAACFANKQGGGLLALIERAERALDTGDFAALGQLRYVFVRRIGESQSHVISVTSLGALPVERMFPVQGDAPGRDLVTGARPPAARRVLSVSVAGSKLQTAMYESLVEPEPALAPFDPALRDYGFARGDLTSVADKLSASTRVYLRADESLLVFADARRGKTAVAAFRLPNGGFVTLE